jgi:hypothetical protein
VQRLFDRCSSRLGGHGYTREFFCARVLHHAKLSRIGEGGNRMQRMVPGTSELLGESHGSRSCALTIISWFTHAGRRAAGLPSAEGDRAVSPDLA